MLKVNQFLTYYKLLGQNYWIAFYQALKLIFNHY